MNKEQLERTIGLLGESTVESFQDKAIAVIGLGGVGGTALEGLVRTGFNNFVIVDGDIVNLSNLNRQILYTRKDIGESKVNAAERRIHAINEECDVKSINLKISEANIGIFDEYKIDFIVDAIDDVNAKVALAKYAMKRNIPMVVSLGMANRFSPSMVEVIRLDKTTNDPLARKLRYELRKNGIDTSKIMAVCSKENPIKDENKLHSIITTPSSAGLNIVEYVIKYFSK